MHMCNSSCSQARLLRYAHTIYKHAYTPFTSYKIKPTRLT